MYKGQAGETSGTLPVKPLEGLLFLTVTGLSLWLLAGPYYLFALIPGIGLLLLFLLGLKPEIGYYLILFLVPFSAYRGFVEGAQFLTVSKIVGFWILILLIVVTLLKKQVTVNLKSNLWPWLSLFLVVNVISLLLSEHGLTALDSLRQLMTALSFFAVSLIFLGIKTMRKNLPAILITSISIGAALSIIGYVFNIPLFAMNVESDSVKRAVGVAHNPNHFAAFVIFSLPLLTHLFFTSAGRSVKIIAALLFVMNIAAIVLTYSRGGALVLSIVLILIALSNIRRVRPRLLGLIASVVGISIVVTLLLVPSSYWLRQKSVTDTADTAIGRRVSYLSVGWDAFKQNPVFGSGPGTFREVYAGSRHALHYADTIEQYRRYAHNTYLEVLIGTGLFGLLLFVACIIRGFLNFHTAGRSLHMKGLFDALSLVKAFRLSFVSVLLYFLLLSSVYHKYFWLSLALSQIALRTAEDAAGDTESHESRHPDQ